MKTSVVVNIDEKGDLYLDFSGYPNRTCEFEEAEMRRILAEMGLGIRVKGAKSKVQQQTMQEPVTPGTRQRIKL